MQYALLGDVQFELITYFEGLDGKFSSDYAEHARIEGKPRLQFIGDKLDEWTLKLKFHQTYCNPEAELVKLMGAKVIHAPLPFVLATGAYKGSFVITEISMVSTKTDGQGTALAMEVTLTLRESIDAVAKKSTAPAVVKAGSKLVQPVAKASTVGLKKPNVPATKLKNAVIAAREIVGAARAVSGIVTLAKSLQNNPLAALEQLRYGVPGFNQIAASADRMGMSLAPLQSSVSGAGPLLTAAGNVGSEARSAVTLLRGATPGNLMSRMASVAGNLSNINTAMDTAAPTLAKLSARTAVRAAV